MPTLVSKSTSPPCEPLPLQKSRRGPTGERVPEVSSLILAAWHHSLFTLTLAIAAAVAAISLTVTLVVAQYYATAYVQVRQREDFLLSNNASRADDVAFVKAQKHIVTQQQTLAHALASDELQSTLKLPVSVTNVEWLRKLLDVEIQSSSEVMTISGVHSDPDIAWHVANAVTEAYLEMVTNNTKEARKARLEELERAAREADSNLAERWNTLHQLAARLGAGNPASLVVSEQVQMQNFREATQQLRSLQIQRNQLELQLADLLRKKDKSQLISPDKVRAVAMKSPEVVARSERLIAIEGKLREFRQLLADQNSERIQTLENQRQYLANQVEQAIADLSPGIREQLQSQQEDLQRVDVTGLEQQIALLKQEEEYIHKSRDGQGETLVENSGAQSVDLEMLRHEIDREEKLANSLWQTISELKIEDQAKPRVALIERPNRPEVPVRTKQYKAAGVAGIVAIILAVFSVGYYEWSLCRIRTPRDVSDHLPIEIYGENTISTGFWLRRWRSHRYQKLVSGVSEVAAQLILTSQVQGRLPCLFVTSATNAEPRDAISSELARVMAQAGHRTLLLDCDFASTALPSRFGLAAVGPDACRIMRITNPVLEDFDFLRGDGENSVSMSMPNGFQSLLEELRKTYSAIVVHGPPILTNAQSVLLATQVDTTLFAVLPEVSRWNLMNAAFHRLQYAGASILGCVFHTSTVTLPTNSRRSQMANNSDGCPLPLTMEEQLQKELQNIRADLARIQSSAPTKVSLSPSGPSPSRNPE